MKKEGLAVILGIGLVTCTAIIGGVMAYSGDVSVMNNVFQVGSSDATFTETFKSPTNWATCETVEKTITVKNNTDQNIIARVKLEEEWNDKDGLGLPLVSNGSGERMAIINFTENSDWTLDGTYYYSQPIAPGATSSSPITGVTLNCDANLDQDYRYAAAEYDLKVKVQTIDAELAATEWHKTSVWQTMSEIKTKIANLSFHNNQDPRTRKFLRADEQGIEWRDVTGDNVISASGAYSLMWYDADADIIYWYSDADDVYMTNTTRASGQVFDIFAYFNDLSGFSDVNTSRVTSLEGLFYGYKGPSLHGLEKWDTSNVTTLRDLFWNHDSGNIADLSPMSRWDVSNVTSLRNTFIGHAALTDVAPLSGWNVRNVTEFYYTFALTNVDSSICTLADWPIKQNFNGDGYGMFETYGKPTPVDARCLDPWSIPLNKSYSWFKPSAFILPSWAH